MQATSPLPAPAGDDVVGSSIEHPTGGGESHSRYLYSPGRPSIAFLLQSANAETGEDDYTSRFCSVVINDAQSALLQMHVPSSASGDSHYTLEVSESVILDVAAKITKVVEERDRSGNICMITYVYQRFDRSLHFDILPILPDEGIVQIQVFDFILSQFAWFDRSHVNLDDDDDADAQQAPSPNAVAKGFEKMGSYMRRGLKASGRATGSAIRYLGSKYTDTTLKFNKDRPPVEVSDQMVAKVGQRKENCESAHATMRSATSTLLYPVRHIGKKAQQYMVSDNVAAATERSEAAEKDKRSSTSKVKKGLYDTAAGIGNGLTSAFKGMTEFVEEVGVAIG